MTHQQSSDGAAIVAPNFHWIPIDENTPQGKSILMISKKAGVLQKGQYVKNDPFFTHWAPMPTFKKEAE